MNKKKNKGSFIFIIAIFAIPGLLYAAENKKISPPVSAATQAVNEILLGQSCDLEGEHKTIGKAFHEGSLAYFSKINAAGGIKGKKIRLVTYNDSSDPGITLKNTERLIEVDKVFALFGYAGAPATFSNIIPFIQKANIPFFAPVSGSESLRTPAIKQVFNLRAGFSEEAQTIVDRLMEKELKKIAIVYENTETGSSAFESTLKVMAKKGIAATVTANIDSNLKNMEEAANKIVRQNPDAIIIAASSRVSAEFTGKIKTNKTESVFINFSFADGESIGSALLNKGIGVVVNQVVPFPHYLKIPVVAEYTKLSEQYTPETEPSFAGIEGFIAAKAICKILNETEGELTRNSFYKAAENQDEADIGGFTFTFNEKEKAGSKFVYLTQIGPGGFVTPIKTLADIYK